MCALLSNIKSGKSGTSKDIKSYLDNLVFTYGTKILEYIGPVPDYITNNNITEYIDNPKGTTIVNIDTSKLKHMSFTNFNPVKLAEFGITELHFKNVGQWGLLIKCIYDEFTFPKTLQLTGDNKEGYIVVAPSNEDRIIFEKGTYLPEVCLDLEDFTFLKNDYIKELSKMIAKGDLFIGGGIIIEDPYGSYEFGALDIPDYPAGHRQILNFFDNFDSYATDKKTPIRKDTYETLKYRIITNLPIYINKNLMLIKLDGSVKGSIEKDKKFWTDQYITTNKNNKNRGRYNLFNNEYLLIYK